MDPRNGRGETSRMLPRVRLIALQKRIVGIVVGHDSINHFTCRQDVILAAEEAANALKDRLGNQDISLPGLRVERNGIGSVQLTTLIVGQFNHFHHPIRVEAPGIEPDATISQSIPDSTVTSRPTIPLAQTLAPETQIDPELARLIDAWPILSPTVKRMILAALDASEPSK